MACLGARVHRILTCTRQVTNGLVSRIGNPHRTQFPRTRELGQAHTITPIGLDPIARAFGDQRRRNHLAVIAPACKRSLQSITRRASFVHDLQFARITVALQQLRYFDHIVRHVRDQPSRCPPYFCYSHRNSVLMHIQSYEKLDIFIHGRSPCLAADDSFSACSSAQIIAQPTSLETGRRPFTSDHIV
jgi:hypothetical protein